MKKVIATLAIIAILSSCATIPKGSKVVYTQNTLQQNLIDIGRTLLSVGITLFGYSVITKKYGEEVRAGMTNIPMPVITIPTNLP